MPTNGSVGASGGSGPAGVRQGKSTPSGGTSVIHASICLYNHIRHSAIAKVAG